MQGSRTQDCCCTRQPWCFPLPFLPQLYLATQNDVQIRTEDESPCERGRLGVASFQGPAQRSSTSDGAVVLQRVRFIAAIRKPFQRKRPQEVRACPMCTRDPVLEFGQVPWTTFGHVPLKKQEKSNDTPLGVPMKKQKRRNDTPLGVP